MSALGQTGDLEAPAEGARELRSKSLLLLASALRRFPAATDYGPLWPRLFTAAAPLMPCFVIEVCRWRPLSRRALIAVAASKRLTGSVQ